jgi:CRP/FNR family transcriptional regulator, cyclic AMP receptor protein
VHRQYHGSGGSEQKFQGIAAAEPGKPEPLIPAITQETLAEMIGTTRSRVSFFMNRFRQLGFIQYNGRIQVHKSLLNVVLHDHMPGDDAQRPELEGV